MNWDEQLSLSLAADQQRTAADIAAAWNCSPERVPRAVLAAAERITEEDTLSYPG